MLLGRTNPGNFNALSFSILGQGVVPLTPEPRIKPSA